MYPTRWACTMSTAVTTPVGRLEHFIACIIWYTQEGTGDPSFPPCLSSRHGCSILHACAVSLNCPLHVVCRSAAELSGSQECRDSTELAVNRRAGGHRCDRSNRSPSDDCVTVTDIFSVHATTSFNYFMTRVSSRLVHTHMHD